MMIGIGKYYAATFRTLAADKGHVPTLSPAKAGKFAFTDPELTWSQLAMSSRRRLCLILLVAGVALSGRLVADVVTEHVGLGWPTTDFKAVLKDVDAVDFVVITYYGGSEAFVTDGEWIGRLKQLLGSAAGTPAQFCFCTNYPQIAFANKDRIIARMEVPHGRKLRFSSGQYSGDFTVDENIAKQIGEMLLSQRQAAVSHRKAPPLAPPPPKIEVNLDGHQSLPPLRPTGD